MTDYIPTKDKITNGFKLKQHILRALELSPSDATLHFMMGRWCYGTFVYMSINATFLQSYLPAIYSLSTQYEYGKRTNNKFLHAMDMQSRVSNGRVSQRPDWKPDRLFYWIMGTKLNLCLPYNII